MAPFLLLTGIPILSIIVGMAQKENINVFLMGFFRDLGRIKANKRRNEETSNAMIAVDGTKYTTWDILLRRDDPIAGIDFSGTEDSPSSVNGSDSTSGSQTTFTVQELEEFGNGRDGNPIYLSIFGRVYDVSKGVKFYGPEGSYHMFAGKDVTRALCTGRKEAEFLVRSTEGLTERHINEGKRWLSFFELHDKYNYIGSMERIDSETWLDALVEEAVAKGKNKAGSQ
jgi:membrane-associated progesterone receptor component